MTRARRRIKTRCTISTSWYSFTYSRAWSTTRAIWLIGTPRIWSSSAQRMLSSKFRICILVMLARMKDYRAARRSLRKALNSLEDHQQRKKTSRSQTRSDQSMDIREMMSTISARIYSIPTSTSSEAAKRESMAHCSQCRNTYHFLESFPASKQQYQPCQQQPPQKTCLCVPMLLS